MKAVFRKKGRGPNIVLLHGWGGSIDSLEGLSESLSEKFTVYNLELPGHGELQEMSTVFGVSDYVEYVQEFIKSEKLESFSLLGHSFGGQLAVNIALKNKNLKALILVNSAGLEPKNSLKKVFWKSISKIFKPLLRIPGFSIFRRFIYKYIIRERDYINTSGRLSETFKKVVNTHLTETQVRKVNSPTLIIWGESDTYTPLWMGRKLNELIGSSTLTVIEGTHSIPLNKPRKITDIIFDWIKNS
jgi:pimeloyl-ACP methyl ester carboxylesterase